MKFLPKATNSKYYSILKGTGEKVLGIQFVRFVVMMTYIFCRHQLGVAQF